MGGGAGDRVAAEEAVLPIDADMVLIAEHRHRDLGLTLGLIGRRLRLSAAFDRPAAVAIDLCATRLLPIARRATAFERDLPLRFSSRWI